MCVGCSDGASNNYMTAKQKIREIAVKGIAEFKRGVLFSFLSCLLDFPMTVFTPHSLLKGIVEFDLFSLG
jgi:hypothetical protein